MYQELREKQQKEFNQFPIFFAFSDEQFKTNAKEKFDLTTEDEYKEQLVSIGCGGFIRKTDSKAFNEMLSRFDKELSEALNQKDFLREAIEYELANHEYCITYDAQEALDALGLKEEDVWNDPEKYMVFKEAESRYLQGCDF